MELLKKMKDLPLNQRMEIYNRAMELRKKKGWGGIKIARKLGIARQTAEQWIYKKRKPFAGASYPPGRLNPPDLNPSAELSYVLGTYYGDGSAYRHRWSWMISLKVIDRDFAEEFNRCFSKVLRREGGYPIWTDSRKFYIVETSNRMLYEFLKKPLKDHKHIIEAFPAEFLRGLFDSDGGAYVYGKWRVVSVANSDLTLLRYVRRLLKRHFSITSGRISIVRRNGATQRWRGQVKRATKDCYQLRIGRRESLLKFQKIGFSIARKQEKLDEICKIKV